MSRLAFFRPFCSGLNARRARRCSVTAMILASCVVASRAARADEFSPVAPGDPIYRQLSALDPTTATGTPALKRSKDKELTRYEAALQVARVITRVSGDHDAKLSRVGWRALRALSASLKGELAQLGIDVTAAQTLADRQLAAPLGADSAPAEGGLGLSTERVLPARIVGAAGNRFAGESSVLSVGGFTPSAAQQTSFSASIMPRLRVGAALMALQRAENDPFNGSASGQALLSAGNGRTLGQSTSVDYDVTSWLSVRALSSRRSLMGDPDTSPLLSAPFFNGATEARGAGGGLNVDVGLLNFSTKIETLSTNAGVRGTSLGGGIGLSAWQNRLSLSAHLARLQPEDRALLSPSTSAEFNVALDVTRRLSLKLFYQGLFTQQNASNSERLAGGLNLSF